MQNKTNNQHPHFESLQAVKVANLENKMRRQQIAIDGANFELHMGFAEYKTSGHLGYGQVSAKQHNNNMKKLTNTYLRALNAYSKTVVELEAIYESR